MALPEIFPLISDDVALKKAAAEPVPGGDAYGMLQELAAKHRIVLHGGSIIERDGDALYNTSVVFDQGGRELARYRKLHMFDIVTPDGKEYRESATFTRGARTVCLDALGTRIGLSICYDVRFRSSTCSWPRTAPRSSGALNFTLQTGKDHWEVLLRARAIETQTYVLAPAQWGRYAGGRLASYGHSLVADPWGHVIAKAQDRSATSPPARSRGGRAGARPDALRPAPRAVMVQLEAMPRRSIRRRISALEEGLHLRDQ